MENVLWLILVSLGFLAIIFIANVAVLLFISKARSGRAVTPEDKPAPPTDAFAGWRPPNPDGTDVNDFV